MRFRIFIFILSISTFGFSQTTGNKILFQGDSIWYAAQNNFLFSSIDKGKKWDTIFAKNKLFGNISSTLDLDSTKKVFNPFNRPLFIVDTTFSVENFDTLPNVFNSIDRVIPALDTVFFSGAFDTATNIFIPDQRTIFIFGWDGTMLYKTILYCSSDCGKTWSKFSVRAESGLVGVKYLHKISLSQFFLDCRNGSFAVTVNSGKKWNYDDLVQDNHGCIKDENFLFDTNGEIRYGYILKLPENTERVDLLSKDGGLTWNGGIGWKDENHK
jgi:hypothetical protein